MYLRSVLDKPGTERINKYIVLPREINTTLQCLDSHYFCVVCVACWSYKSCTLNHVFCLVCVELHILYTEQIFLSTLCGLFGVTLIQYTEPLLLSNLYG